MRRLGSSRGDSTERGQVLILWILAATVILVIGAIVIDVGLWLTERRKVQMAADFAALAAASELGNGTAQVEARAREFASRNGFAHSPSTGTTVEVVTPYAGDSGLVEVKIKETSPGGLTGIFTAAGSAFDIGARAVGGLGSGDPGPLDAIMILDRTGSMSDADIVNAKNAAKAALQVFEPNIQHIGLGVIRASDPGDICGDNDPGLWVPVPPSPGMPLSSDYKDANGNLNSSSLLVSTIDCLRKSTGAGTNLGDPVRTSREYLNNTPPRSNVKKAIILLTDGQATHPSGTVNFNTGFVDCAGQAPYTAGSGDNNGFETNSAGACGDGGTFAADMDSGTNTNTNCGNSGKDRHLFSDFNISVPAGSTIQGIEVLLDAWADSSSGSPRMCVELSWDGGTSWTSAQTTNNNLSTSESSVRVGDQSDDWGRTWAANELSSLRVRVTNRSSNAGRDFFLDRVAVQVTYNDGPRTPCNYAFQQASGAKGDGIEVYTIGYGISAATCTNDSTGPYRNVRVTRLLADMATDSLDDQANCTAENGDRDHYFCEAADKDLTPVFQRIAEDLTSGYRIHE